MRRRKKNKRKKNIYLNCVQGGGRLQNILEFNCNFSISKGCSLGSMQACSAHKGEVPNRNIFLPCSIFSKYVCKALWVTMEMFLGQDTIKN